MLIFTMIFYYDKIYITLGSKAWNHDVLARKWFYGLMTLTSFTWYQSSTEQSVGIIGIDRACISAGTIQEWGGRKIVFCTKCGAKLPDNAKFCPKCGNPCTIKKQFSEQVNQTFRSTERKMESEIHNVKQSFSSNNQMPAGRKETAGWQKSCHIHTAVDRYLRNLQLLFHI